MDGNGHHSAWGSPSSNARGKILFNWLTNNNLFLLNTGCPTLEVPNGTYTHIDLSLTSQQLHLCLSWDTYHDNITSDHYPIIIESSNHVYQNVIPSPRFKLEQANWTKFQKSLHLPLPPFKSPTETYNSLETCILSSVKSIIPISLGNPNPNNKRHYWWNSACSVALKQKKQAFKHYKRNRGNDEAWINYRKKKAHLSFVLNKARKEAWEKFTSTFKEDTRSKIVWDKVKALRNKKNFQIYHT